MKALTVQQPFAGLIVTGRQLVENRTWRTNYRGPLAIHASRSRASLGVVGIDLSELDGATSVFGALVGMAVLLDCLPIANIRVGEYDVRYPWLCDHPYTQGPWCFVFGEVRRFPAPIPWTGSQGMWNLPDGITQEMRAPSD